MNHFAKRPRIILLAILWTTLISGCVEKEIGNEPQKAFGIAKEPFDNGKYEEAVKLLSEFKSRFPYSQLAVEAELLIADSHFQLDHFQEAALAYEAFGKLHPKHPKVDYALFRVAESYWEDAPEAVSRDQEYTEKAVAGWQEVVKRFPTTSYADRSKSMIEKGRRRLAESIELIAKFYCNREIWHSCAFRYTQLLDKYPEYKDLAQEALENAAFALERVADAKEKDPSSDKNLYHRTMTAQQIREKAANFRRLIKG